MSGGVFVPRMYRGALISASVPSNDRVQRRPPSSLRAVVINTFLTNADIGGPTDAAPAFRTQVLCDVMTYSTVPGVPRHMLYKVPVRQDRGHMHEGEQWIPRGTTQRFDGETDMGRLLRVNPGDIDGEHVEIGFIDGSPTLPIITGGLDHPRKDQGNENAESGQRLTPVLEDGYPRFVKHHGVVHGVTKNGDYQIDLQKAHLGTIQPDGTEPLPLENGTSGSYRVRLQKGATYTVIGPEGQFVILFPDGRVELSNANGGVQIDANGTVRANTPKVELGANATEHVLNGDAWAAKHQAWLARLLDLHTALQVFFASAKLEPLTQDPATVTTFTGAMAQLQALLAPAVGTLMVPELEYFATAPLLSTKVTVEP